VGDIGRYRIIGSLQQACSEWPVKHEMDPYALSRTDALWVREGVQKPASLDLPPRYVVTFKEQGDCGCDLTWAQPQGNE
jgi:hypothetical protein